MSAENGGGRDGGAEASVAAILAAATVTPIAQLGPDLTNNFGSIPRAVRGDVTIVWPYNSVSRSLAFLLAEPDVRLRRSKGQIRVQLHGASAAAVAESGLGGGDELLLSLQGASWSKDESSLKLPGSRVEWQLEFRGCIVLQAKVGEIQEARAININQPDNETNGNTEIEPARDGANGTASPDYGPPPSSPPISDLFRSPMPPRVTMTNNEEYASPAFIKRARISFGSLFEPGFDIFEEDGDVRGRGRKRTRFGRPSNSWRYSSRSVSPEQEPRHATPPEDEEESEKKEAPTVEVPTSPAVALQAATPTPAPRPETQTAAAPKSPVPQTESQPQQVDQSMRSSPPLTTSQIKTSTPANRQEPTQQAAAAAIAASTTNVFGSVPDVQMGGMSNPFAASQRSPSTLFGSTTQPSSSNPFATSSLPASTNPFGAPTSTTTTNPFGAPASSTNVGNPFGAPAVTENANPFGAPTAVPFGTPGADALGFVADAGLFNDNVRFSFGDPTNTFEQQPLDPHLDHAHDTEVPALPSTEDHFAESQYQYPEPPSQHTSHTSAFGHGGFGAPTATTEEAHPEMNEPPRSTGQDQMLVWPISAPTLDAEHAEGAIPADTLPMSHPATGTQTPSVETPNNNNNNIAAASASFIASGANEGVFEDDDTAEMASDLPREVDVYGYNDRRYQNEQEEAMVDMVDDGPPSRESEEDDLESDGPEEAEPTDHLAAEDEDEEEEDDAEGDDDDVEPVEVIDEDGGIQVEDEAEDEESEDDVDSEVEKTDQPGDDYDMRNYAEIDDDIEGEEEPDEQGGAATFNGEGEDDEEDEEDEEEEEEEYDEEEDAEAEADDDHYAAAPQHSFSTGRRLDEDEDEEMGSEEYDEEEEDYDEEEEEEEEDDGGHQSMGYQRPRMFQPPARPSQPAEPVVIDLLSDSDDDDAPPPPRQQSKPVSETPIPPPSVPVFGQPSGAQKHPEAASNPPEEEDEDEEEGSEGEEEDEGGFEEEEQEELIEDEAEEDEDDEDEGEGEEEPEEEPEEEENAASDGSDDEMEIEEPQPEPKQDEPAAATEAEPETKSESEDEVEKEMEAELDAELAADAKAEAEAEKAEEVKETDEADEVETAEKTEDIEDLPADTEKVEAIVIKEPAETTEAHPTENFEVVVEWTTEQATVDAPVEVEKVDDDQDAPEAVPEASQQDAAEKQADAEPAAPEPPKSPAAVEVEPVTEKQLEPEPATETQDQQDVDSEDVAMAEADVEVHEEAQPEEPPEEVVIELSEAPPAPEPAHKTRSQTAQLAQEATAQASASETPFSPPPTQLGTSQDGAAEVAVVDLPSLSGTQTTEHAEPSAAQAQAHLLTPMQTQEGVDSNIERHDHFQGASFTYTEVTSIAEEEDIDGQIQSQIMSEMAISFEFDQQQQQQLADIDMHSVASGADVEMADHNEEGDDQMMDEEEAAQTPRQTVQDHGDSMDVDAGTDIDMQSVVEEVLDEVGIVVTEPAPEEEEQASDAAAQSAKPADASTEARADKEDAEAPATTLHKDANEKTAEEPTGETRDQTKSSQDQQQQQHDDQHPQVTTEDTVSTTEGRHKMSLRSTNSRLRRSLSPQLVVSSSTANDASNKAAASAAAMTAAVADAGSPEEPDASVQIARGATTRRSKRARAASASQPTASQDDGAAASAASAGAAAVAAAVNPTKEDTAAGEDVSVLIARGATSKKRTTPKAKDNKEGEKKEKEKEKTVEPTILAPPPSMAEVKLALDRCRDTVPDCVQLRNLRPRLRTLLDVAVVATSSSDDHPPRRTRTRQYAMSLTATDPSLVEHVSASRHHLHNLHGGTGSRRASPAAVVTNVNDNASDTGSVSVSTSVAAGTDIDAIIEVSLFRAHKDTLPTFHAGDGLLLRRFEVVALHDKGFGLRSTDESAYAVFPAKEFVEEGADDKEGDNNGNASPTPQVNGPPVEDMDREARYISLLKQWYHLLDEGACAQLSAANARFVAVDEAAKLVEGESQ
ncbi:hypothetical protein Sste5346_005733 [Sporothrix stenoceras]|uniref:Telomeric single stranded DNA binding POT1/Cdc13 domain-containing protein n=1 Tax=Sporothrix stenoceras TaxID=5173 RepID=A0ABR3Z2B0_9PEZI